MTWIRWGGKWVHLAYFQPLCHLSAKNYQNWYKFDEVLTKTILHSFFETQFSCCNVISFSVLKRFLKCNSIAAKYHRKLWYRLILGGLFVRVPQFSCWVVKWAMFITVTLQHIMTGTCHMSTRFHLMHLVYRWFGHDVQWMEDYRRVKMAVHWIHDEKRNCGQPCIMDMHYGVERSSWWTLHRRCLFQGKGQSTIRETD